MTRSRISSKAISRTMSRTSTKTRKRTRTKTRSRTRTKTSTGSMTMTRKITRRKSRIFGDGCSPRRCTQGWTLLLAGQGEEGSGLRILGSRSEPCKLRSVPQLEFFVFGSISTPFENFIANIGKEKSVQHQTINTNISCKMRIEIQNPDPDNEMGITE